ncbi:hypothetical protein [Gordonia oryzae]|uniref:hypothetical protein n=1 Tax=Gordonia oryzae TaxID=2487349 RepID=UPI000F4E268B|nr:hypothetical protein [Gordonia oryzae]
MGELLVYRCGTGPVEVLFEQRTGQCPDCGRIGCVESADVVGDRYGDISRGRLIGIRVDNRAAKIVAVIAAPTSKTHKKNRAAPEPPTSRQSSLANSFGSECVQRVESAARRILIEVETYRYRQINQVEARVGVASAWMGCPSGNETVSLTGARRPTNGIPRKRISMREP